MTKKFGWKRPTVPVQTPFMFAPAFRIALPPFADLSNHMPAVYDQGDLGSCTANSGASLAEFVMKKTGRKHYKASRLAIYYWTRLADGTVHEDAGSSMYQTMATLSGRGVPHEAIWWYNIAKFTVKPNKKVEADAGNHVMSMGLSVVQDINHMRSCIAQGWPFIFGFAVYESFDTAAVASTGMMPMPQHGEQVLGGHAVMAYGYDDSKRVFKVRNSWGRNWGVNGDFYMPYDFIASNQFADDFWTCHDYRKWQ